MPAVVALGQDPSAAGAGNTPDPLHAKERVRWVMESTVGPVSLMTGLVNAGWGTLIDVPKEYDTHWKGFAKRYGMRMTGIATEDVLEAGLGAIWGEDPRYVRLPDAPFTHRIGHILCMTFLARDRDGNTMPAYARYLAIPGTNFLSNTWRPDSEATAGHALIRTGFGFLGRAGSNTFHEFWPDVRQKVSRGKSSSPSVQRTVCN